MTNSTQQTKITDWGESQIPPEILAYSRLVDAEGLDEADAPVATAQAMVGVGYALLATLTRLDRLGEHLSHLGALEEISGRLTELAGRTDTAHWVIDLFKNVDLSEVAADIHKITDMLGRAEAWRR